MQTLDKNWRLSVRRPSEILSDIFTTEESFVIPEFWGEREYYLNGFDPIKEIPNGCYLTGFFSNYPSQAAIDRIFAFIDKHNITPFIGAVFKFSDIKQAIKAQEKGVDGEIVVVMD